MNTFLDREAVQDYVIHSQEQFPEITTAVSHQHVNEMCCICQGCILMNLFKFSLFTPY